MTAQQQSEALITPSQGKERLLSKFLVAGTMGAESSFSTCL
jgi:hypothetical protein